MCKKQRKSWDKYFLEIATVVATRSTCPRLQVGTVLVKDKQIIATGYNGAPPGFPHCEDVGCKLNGEGRCTVTHSEQSAILFADREKLKGATAYVTHEPCENCSRLLVQAGIVKIVYMHPYKNQLNDYYMQNLEVVQLHEDELLYD